MNDNADQKRRCNGTPKDERARAVLHYTALAMEAKAWRRLVDMEVDDTAAPSKLQSRLIGDSRSPA